MLFAALRGRTGRESPVTLQPHSRGNRLRRQVRRPREPQGERRYLTVMFCDLVGSTSISAGLDAEEWRDLVGAYLDAASAAVTEFGGHVAERAG